MEVQLIIFDENKIEIPLDRAGEMDIRNVHIDDAAGVICLDVKPVSNSEN